VIGGEAVNTNSIVVGLDLNPQ